MCHTKCDRLNNKCLTKEELFETLFPRENTKATVNKNIVRCYTVHVRVGNERKALGKPKEAYKLYGLIEVYHPTRKSKCKKCGDKLRESSRYENIRRDEKQQSSREASVAVSAPSSVKTF